MKISFLVLLALLGISGCSNNAPTPDTSTVDATIAPSSTSTAPSSPQIPDWANKVNVAISCIGKSKADVVAALGEPERMFGNGYSSGSNYRQQYRYSNGGESIGNGSAEDRYAADFVQMEFVERNGKKIVDAVVCEFSGTRGSTNDNRKSAGEVWSAIGGEDAGPATMLTYMGSIKQFLINKNSNSDSGRSDRYRVISEITLYLKGQTKSHHKVVLNCVSIKPPLMGAVEFNTDTDQREVGDLTPYSEFSWMECLVDKVTIGQGSNEPQVGYDRGQGENGVEFPLQ